MSEGQIYEEPFFIVYDARSGSTFLANLLVKSLNVVIPPETNFITRLIDYQGTELQQIVQNKNNIIELLLQEEKFFDMGLSPELVEKTVHEVEFPCVGNIILALLNEYKKLNTEGAKQLVGIKKGSYLPYFEQIKTLFPRAKFIGIIRDGRAVFRSKKKSIYSKTGKPFETDPYRCALNWCNSLELLNNVSARFPQDVLILTYEEMVIDPDYAVNQVAEYLDLSTYPEKRLTIESKEDKSYFVSSRYGNLHKNINKQPISDRIRAWKGELNDREIFAFESIAHNYLREAGYSPLHNKEALTNRFARISNRIYMLLDKFRK